MLDWSKFSTSVIVKCKFKLQDFIFQIKSVMLIAPLTYETMFLLHRNQSTDLRSKSIDWFLYDGNFGRWWVSEVLFHWQCRTSLGYLEPNHGRFAQPNLIASLILNWPISCFLSWFRYNFYQFQLQLISCSSAIHCFLDLTKTLFFSCELQFRFLASFSCPPWKAVNTALNHISQFAISLHFVAFNSKL